MQDHKRHISIMAAVVYGTGLLVLATFGMLIWLLFLDPVTPLESTRLVKLEVVNPRQADERPYLVVTREFCFSGPSEALVSRKFSRPSEDGRLGEVIEVDGGRINLDGGCYIRPRQIPLPSGITSGPWTYQATIRWTNAIGRSVSVRTSAIAMEVDLGPPDGRRILKAEEVR